MEAIGRGASIALLGLPGTGKTFLLKHLADRLRRDGLAVAVRNRPAGSSDDAFDVLLVDEADSLPADELRNLCERTPIVVLAGLPSFARVITTLPRPIVTITLEPLSAENVARFMATRLRELGQPTTRFTPEAILNLTAHSAGLMRLVVILSGSAMFLAGHEEATQVTARHVDEANALRFDADDANTAIAATTAPARIEVGQRQSHSRPRRLSPVLVGVAASLLAGIGVWASLQRSGPAPHGSAQAVPAAPASRAPVIASVEKLPAPTDPAPDSTPTVTAPPTPRPPPSRPAPIARLPASPSNVDRATAYTGPVLSVTMQQGGQLTLLVQRHEGRSVTVEFHASAGLIGTGQLVGTMTGDGRIAVDGRLMMGRNPFDCILSAVATGDSLVGEASFTRVGASSSSRSTFTLAKRG